MTWGPYWMYYKCLNCGKKFRTENDFITEEDFGKCPICRKPASFEGESKNLPAEPDTYEIIEP